ncbi:hypothetical protein CY34DRAFT_773543 [Suillus luteus UH-Slu-Lm8-n1]|uniref:Uncharacterized protein n=1 Tax=Suillus luteus UH-Slu-Lm8-n1 TaxID=930992 RepID=A0A0C9ZKR3_9AGAM|nr:hypothetical protein CY34DRAFT_773543 [Suillus luteus UH-Slu-Lm8-n1]
MITSSSNRCLRTSVFITDRDHHMFSPHFHDLIYSLERTSKKPTGTILNQWSSPQLHMPVFSIVFRELQNGACRNSELGNGWWISSASFQFISQ